MTEQTYIRFPKPEHQQRTKRLTDPSTYATATWRNTTPLGGMVGIGFYTFGNITSLVKLDKENAQLLFESLRDYLEIEPCTEPTGKAAASTGL